MSDLSLQARELIERERIQTEYARRQRNLPSNLYEWDRLENQFAHNQIRRKAIAALATESLFPLNGRRVLDVGCGRGRWLLEFAQWGANADDLHGIDLLEDRINEARLKLPASHLDWGEATCLPWPDQYFDLVTQFTVFTSILDPNIKKDLAAEMIRVTRPGGAILWYDSVSTIPGTRMCGGLTPGGAPKPVPGLSHPAAENYAGPAIGPPDCADFLDRGSGT